MKSSSRSEAFFATCPRGLEAVLALELAGLGAEGVRATDGGVAFQGPLAMLYRANYASRIASRVLWRVAHGRYRNEEEIYRGALAIDWPGYFPVDCSIRVNVSAVASPLKSLDFVTLRIKDAVCDRFRQRAGGQRPSVDTANPAVRIHAFLTAQAWTLYLDTSGEALFKRGYRRDAGAAPLRENLAAGILRLTGWTADQPLLDPMCGSGTFLIEAASIALGIAPGARRHFGFERLGVHDERLWQRERAELDARRKPLPLQIFGSDRDAGAVEGARRNLLEAGLEREVTLACADVLQLAAPADSGVMVMNPPYGVRLDEQENLAAFYPGLGDALKRGFAGWRAYILTGDLRLPKLIGLSPSKRTPLYNGALECRLYEFKMVAGAMRRAGMKDEG